MLSKKDELWRNIESMRNKENEVDKEEDMMSRDTDRWDFLPDTLILPDEWERWVLLQLIDNFWYLELLC